MSHLPRISIAAATDVEQLRLSVEKAVNSLIDRIEASKVSEDQRFNQYRLKDIGRPASQHDAVNVAYLDERLRDFARRIDAHLHQIDDEVRLTTGGTSTVITTATPPDPVTTVTATVAEFQTRLGGDQYARIEVAWTLPVTVEGDEIAQIWAYEGTSTATAPDPEVTIPIQESPYSQLASAGTNSFWVPRGDSDTIYWCFVTLAAPDVWPTPTSSTPNDVVVVTSYADATQVTGFDVNLTTGDAGGLPVGRFTFTFTPPADPEFWYARIERIATDTAFSPIGTIWALVAGEPEPTEQLDWWSLPPTDEYWQFRARAVNQAGVPNSASAPTDNVLVPANTGVGTGIAPPDAVASVNATNTEYRTDLGGKQYARIDVTWNLGTATRVGDEIAQIWLYEGTSTTTAPDPTATTPLQESPYSQFADQLYNEFWVPRTDAQKTYWCFVTLARPGVWPLPTASTPSDYEVIEAYGDAPQVTGFSVATTTGNAGGVPSARFTCTFTPPADPEFWYASIERIATDSAFATLSGATWSRIAGEEESFEQKDWWSLPPTTEYWKFRSRSVNQAGKHNDTAAPTANVTVAANTGLNLGKSDPTTIGQGLNVDGFEIKIPDTGIAESMLGTGVVSNSKLANLAVDAAKLANSAVTSTKIANLAVGTAAIANLAVGTAQIAALAVSEAKLADLSVSTAKIQNLAVSDAKIASLTVGKLTAGTASFAGTVTFANTGSVQVNSGSLLSSTAPNNFFQNQILIGSTGSILLLPHPTQPVVTITNSGILSCRNIIHTATTAAIPASGFMFYRNGSQLRIRTHDGFDREVQLDLPLS